MDSGERTQPEVIIQRKGVGVETLGLFLGAALLGAAAAVSILRMMEGGVETVSMTGLLTFLFTLGLVLAALVLAVVAISLSRVAERSIERTAAAVRAAPASAASAAVNVDEIVERLEASVQELGSSITDGIYGNFASLSEEIQQTLPTRDGLREDVTDAIEKTLADLRPLPVDEAAPPAEEETPQIAPPAADEIQSESAAPVADTVEEPEPSAEEEVPAAAPVDAADNEAREQADKKYDEFKNIVLLGVANFPGMVARKIGEGHYRTEGDDLVDGAFVANSETVAVCTFCLDDTIADRFMGEQGDSFNGFLKSLLHELKKGHFSRIFLVFDKPLSDRSPYAHALNEFSLSVNSETFSRFELFEGSADVIIPQLTERVSRLMEADDATEQADEQESTPELSFRSRMGS